MSIVSSTTDEVDGAQLLKKVQDMIKDGLQKLDYITSRCTNASSTLEDLNNTLSSVTSSSSSSISAASPGSASTNFDLLLSIQVVLQEELDTMRTIVKEMEAMEMNLENVSPCDI